MMNCLSNAGENDGKHKKKQYANVFFHSKINSDRQVKIVVTTIQVQINSFYEKLTNLTKHITRLSCSFVKNSFFIPQWYSFYL